MKIILTGATGLVGAEVLAQALQDPAIEQVTVLTRRPVGRAHEKLKEILVKDFLAYPPALMAELKDHDACLWCLGISQNDVNEEDYIKITYGYTLHAAQFLFALNPALRFCFLSGQGADQAEKSLALFGRIKGRTEKALSAFSSNVIHFRPGYIAPSTPRPKPLLAERVMHPIAPLINALTDNFSVTSAQLARCMIDVAKTGAAQTILDNRFIRNWA